MLHWCQDWSKYTGNELALGAAAANHDSAPQVCQLTGVAQMLEVVLSAEFVEGKVLPAVAALQIRA